MEFFYLVRHDKEQRQQKLCVYVHASTDVTPCPCSCGFQEDKLSVNNENVFCADLALDNILNY